MKEISEIANIEEFIIVFVGEFVLIYDNSSFSLTVDGGRYKDKYADILAFVIGETEHVENHSYNRDY